MVAVLGIVATYSVVNPSFAFAANVTGSSFEIDANANLVVNGGAPAIDWLTGGTGTAMRAGVVVKTDLPTGQTDDSFTGGTKNDSIVPKVDTGSVPNNKSDLKQYGNFVEKNASGTFVNVFWTRVQDPNGTTAMDFEFNQSATNNNTWGPKPPPYYPTEIMPTRTTGDLLVTYELENGGVNPVLARRTWLASDEWGPATTFDASQAIGSINTSAIAANQSGGLGALGARTFGEASISLAALVPDQDTCVTFGSVFVKSRSSHVLDEELKDFIAPEPTSISNCGSITIHKTDDDGSLNGAGFSLYKDVAPQGGNQAGAEDTTQANLVDTCTTTGDGDCSFTNVKKGQYWVVETTIPAAHDGAPDQHVTITEGDQLVELTFNDPIQHGTLVIIKNAVPDDDQDFTFTRDGTPFSLDDDGNNANALSNTSSTQVVVGTHTVVETNIPSGWVNTALSCTDPSQNSSVNLGTHTVTANVGKNETVTCTYTDTFTVLSPHLATQVAVAVSNTSWNDTASLTGDGIHPVTGNVTFYACAPQATATACAAGGTQVGSPAAVTGSGSSFSAQTTTPFTPSGAGWTCFRAEFVSTSAFYANDSHTNATTECFLKRNANLTVSKTAVATYGRAFTWTIDKDVNQTRFDIPENGQAHVTYTVKVGNSSSDSAWKVTGKITVANSNPVAFTGVDVTDAIDNGAGSCSVIGGANATVPANGTLVLDYTCTYASAPSPPAGTNTATATWNSAAYFTTANTASGTADVDFSQISPSTTDEIVTVTDPMGGGTLGTVNALTDPNPQTFTYSVDTFGIPGTCTQYDNTATFTTNDTQTSDSASQSVVVCVGRDLVVSKTVTATFDRTYHWTIDKAVRGDATRNVPAGTTPSFTYDVTVAPDGFVDSGFAMSGTIHVVNPNDWEDIVATITDTSDVGGGVSCAVTNGVSRTIPKGGSLDLAYSCTFSGQPSSGENTATATWNAQTAHTPNGTASGQADVTFQLVKETNKTITVTDNKANPSTLGTATYDGQSHTFTYTREVPGTPGTCIDDTNTATIVETGQSDSVTVTVCVGLDLTVSKTAIATDHRTYLWDLAKDVDKTRVDIAENGTATFHYTVTATPDGLTKDGWSVTGQVTVTNPNDWEDIAVDLSDSLDTGGGSDCTFPGGTHVVVLKGTQSSYDYVCAFDSQPADGKNTATATWDKAAAATPNGSASGEAEVVFVPSSETNKTITVIDDMTDPENPVVLGEATWGEEPTSFSYDVEKQGVAGTCTDYTNTAIIVPALQLERLVLAEQIVLDTASQTVTVCVGQGLTTEMDASASLSRAYNWLIDKSVDLTEVTLPNGQDATFTYTVKVTPNGIVDSGYTMGGSVTVANPNDWEDITADVTVTSDVGGGVSCTVTGGEDAVVPMDGELTLPYSCSFTGVPNLSGTNSATAAWDAEAASTNDDSSLGSAEVEFSIEGNTNRTITVTDDKTDPDNPVELGTATYDDVEKSFTYALTKAGVPGTAAAPGCVDYTNIAVIVETEQNDDQVVTLCHTFTGGGGTPVVNPPQGGGLPFTGDALGLLARTSIAMIGAGLVLVAVNRRRRTA